MVSEFPISQFRQINGTRRMAREKVMQLLVSCSSSDISWEEIFPHIVFRNFSFLEHEAEPQKLLTTEEINELDSDTRIHWEESELDFIKEF